MMLPEILNVTEFWRVNEIFRIKDKCNKDKYSCIAVACWAYYRLYSYESVCKL